ncbi:MAG: prolyl-tRNA synthetase associated domain-containing protein [bacterium]|nr:prolyl-tRNA synthetase associated domain-containing protein [bacterium]
MELQLYEGRPTDISDRVEKEVRVYDFLDALGIPYYRTDHEHADTMEACQEIDAILDTMICKNLFLCNRQKTNFYLLMMPGDKNFKTKELSSQINSARLSFGSPEDMERLLDVTPGSASIMGLMNDKENQVRLLIDEDVLKEEFIGCHPCINTSSLKIATKDIVEKFIPAVHHDITLVTLTGKE